MVYKQPERERQRENWRLEIGSMKLKKKRNISQWLYLWSLFIWLCFDYSLIVLHLQRVLRENVSIPFAIKVSLLSYYFIFFQLAFFIILFRIHIITQITSTIDLVGLVNWPILAWALANQYSWTFCYTYSVHNSQIVITTILPFVPHASVNMNPFIILHANLLIIR